MVRDEQPFVSLTQRSREVGREGTRGPNPVAISAAQGPRPPKRETSKQTESEKEKKICGVVGKKKIRDGTKVHCFQYPIRWKRDFAEGGISWTHFDSGGREKGQIAPSRQTLCLSAAAGKEHYKPSKTSRSSIARGERD